MGGGRHGRASRERESAGAVGKMVQQQTAGQPRGVANRGAGELRGCGPDIHERGIQGRNGGSPTVVTASMRSEFWDDGKGPSVVAGAGLAVGCLAHPNTNETRLPKGWVTDITITAAHETMKQTSWEKFREKEKGEEGRGTEVKATHVPPAASSCARQPDREGEMEGRGRRHRKEVKERTGPKVLNCGGDPVQTRRKENPMKVEKKQTCAMPDPQGCATLAGESAL